MFIPGCCILCLCVCLPLFRYNKKKDLKLAVCFKVLGTLCSFMLVLVAAIRLDHLSWLCAAALFLFAIADALLEYNWVWGGTFFALGHFCMIIWSLSKYTVSVTHLICCFVLLVALAFLFWHFRSGVNRKMMIPAMLYGTILSVMAGCCIAGGLSPEAFNSSGWLMTAGGGLFFISDCLILIRTAEGAKAPSWLDTAVMITYYCALLCIGSSCLL